LLKKRKSPKRENNGRNIKLLNIDFGINGLRTKIESRKPNFFVSSTVAKQTKEK